MDETLGLNARELQAEMTAYMREMIHEGDDNGGDEEYAECPAVLCMQRGSEWVFLADWTRDGCSFAAG